MKKFCKQCGKEFLTEYPIKLYCDLIRRENRSRTKIFNDFLIIAASKMREKLFLETVGKYYKKFCEIIF